MAHTNFSQIQELVEKLQRVTRDAPHNLQVHEDLAELQRMTQRIQAVLNDAEKREIKDGSVGLWLKELKGVTYDAEDVLDEYNYELLRAKVESDIQPDEATHHLPCKRKHCEVSESTVTSIALDASFCGEIADKIRKIRDRFVNISKQRDDLHLREEDGPMHSVVTSHRPPSSHIVDAPEIYGREDDMEKVIDRLLYSDECKKSNLLVLPIVGMGGVGKTTLVQHVYNDPRICDHFPLKGWVCVSNNFIVQEVTGRIIESFTKKSCDLKEFSALQAKLEELLDGKRFLLILDDVWNENRELWDSLRKALKYGVQGSAVITTTRNESVAKIMKTMPFLCLNCLSFNDCLAVFIKSAFVDRDPDDHPDLMEIGKEIVEKCGGLPLAAKSLGGLLSYKNDADEWDGVLQSDIWDLRDEGGMIIPALRLSYLHLPSYLKQCFLYAAVFPKDFEFRKVELILLWMAQGFLQCKGSKQAEDFGNEYFNELVQRSLFQYCPESSNEERPVFVMHDLIHDLAQHISAGEFFHMDRDCPHSEVHHVSAIDQRVEDLEKMLHAPWANIRTLMGRGTLEEQWESSDYLIQMMPHLGFLRTLHLVESGIDELPDSVGDLKHLRYLNLDESGIKRLPDSVCKLYNLQTLSLVCCKYLRRLPKDIGNLCNLRCLNIEGTNLDFLPSGFGKLTSLHALDVFPVLSRGWPSFPEDYSGTEEELNDLSLQVSNEEGPISPEDYSGTEELNDLSLLQVSNEEGCGIEVLKDLIHLRGTLGISNLNYVMDAEDARLADLRNKRGIRKLFLDWFRFGKWFYLEGASPEVQTQVLENLRPPDRLEELKIRRYNGLRFPSWMRDDPSSLSKLVRVQLYDCKKCRTLPPLGQLPSLKYLQIEGMVGVEAIGPEFRGHASVGFPALEELKFAVLHNWVTWESAAQRGDFPRLRLLTVHGCEKLKSMVPLYLLPALEELDILRGGDLTYINLWSTPPSIGPSSRLRSMRIKDRPRACFSSEDDKHLSLHPALCDLTIYNSPLIRCWMGDDPSSLSKLVRVQLQSCEECRTLPPLGQLPYLKHLKISFMHMVEAVGPEFGGHASVGFPALEELTLRYMGGWVTWESAAESGDFPRLRLLTIEGCKKLKSMVPLYLLPALQELAIYRCGELSINLWGRSPSIGPPPPLRTMKITDCPRACFSPDDDEHLSLPPALCELTIVDAPLMVEWCEGGGGTRLAHIPNAKIWTKKNGGKIVSTFVPNVVDGKFLLPTWCYPWSVEVQDGEEGDR